MTTSEKLEALTDFTNSTSGRVILPAFMEKGRVFAALENAIRLTDYKYTIVPESYEIIILVSDNETIKISLEFEKGD